MPKPFIPLGWDDDENPTAFMWHFESWTDDPASPDGHTITFYKDTASLVCSCLGAKRWYKSVPLEGDGGACKHAGLLRRILTDRGFGQNSGSES